MQVRILPRELEIRPDKCGQLGENEMREAILNASDTKIETVQTPEWAAAGIAQIQIRSMTAREQREYSEQAKTRKTDAGGLLVARIACLPDGSRVFEDSDADQLEGKSAAVINRIVQAWTQMMGLDAKSVEDTAKN